MKMKQTLRNGLFRWLAGAALLGPLAVAAADASGELRSIFAAFGQTNVGDTVKELVGGSITIPIPSLPGEAKKLELVLVPGSASVKPFFMSKYELTQAQYKAMMTTNPSAFKSGNDHPVEQVSWNDAKEFCRRLTAELPGQLKDKAEFRLPTNAEWSAAAGLPEERASTSQEKDRKIQDHFPWGTEWPPPQGAGNYAGEAHKRAGFNGILECYDDGYGRTAPVGSYKPNEFGLCDLGGHVWEWCEDKYPPDSESRLWRGASWNDDERDSLLSSYRYNYTPGYRSSRIGVRLVLGGLAP